MIEYVQQNLQYLATVFMVLSIIALTSILALWVAWVRPAETRASVAEREADRLRIERDRARVGLARAVAAQLGCAEGDFERDTVRP